MNFVTRNIELFLLHALNIRPGGTMELSHRIKRLTKDYPAHSTLYATLVKLEREGVVRGRMLVRAKKYSITRKGVKRLEFLIKTYVFKDV